VTLGKGVAFWLVSPIDKFFTQLMLIFYFLNQLIAQMHSKDLKSCEKKNITMG
jgi:hypothetical protein